MCSRAATISIHDQGALEFVQSLLRQGISVRIQVSGDSMRPLLKGGELVEIAPLEGNSLQLGEILFLRDQQGYPIVHRLIWRRSQGGMLFLLTKGDACPYFDGFVPAEQVLGRVRRIIPADSSCAIDLRTRRRRLQAALFVSHALFGHALRKSSAKLRQQLSAFL